MFSCQYVESGKLNVPILDIGCSNFCGFADKPDDPIFQTRLSDFDRLIICFSKF
jgi:hypothetical protein